MAVTRIQLLDLTLPMIFMNTTLNGCDVWEIGQYCDRTYGDSAIVCIAQSFKLLGENGTTTPDKFLNEFVQNYAADHAALDIFAKVARKCVNDVVKHEPILASEVGKILGCIMVPATKLENALGCKFKHPLK